MQLSDEMLAEMWSKFFFKQLKYISINASCKGMIKTMKNCLVLFS